MQFFDLNIPYMESEKSIPDKSSKKQTRLKLIVKAMEFGYSGIAFNRSIKGVMAESDRCTISPFPLSSLLHLSPSLSSTVSFHRRLLGVPENSSFRQYTRLTMSVETSAQASALNSGNPILKTYDLIAIKPLNQNCFDLACQSSQVDLISIDFAEKLPFRLKLPMIKAAIARGVYFEIMYSSLLQDVQVRRQMISSVKLLVEWTRGKNLIVSSAAPSVLELRGPNDVANLLSLLGLSNEFAKATISKNCRLLLANALRKKQFYKEAIRVEVMPSGRQTDPKEPWIVDQMDWDPLSSGEGDLLLDDIAKAFAQSGNISQTVKRVDCSNVVGSAQSHGLQVNDLTSRPEAVSCMSGNFKDIDSSSKDLELSKKTALDEPTLCSSLLGDLDRPGKASEVCHQTGFLMSPVASANVKDFGVNSTVPPQQLKNSDRLENATSPVRLRESELQNHVSIATDSALLSVNAMEMASEVDGSDLGSTTGLGKEILKNYVDVNCAQTDGSKLASGVSNSTDTRISTEMKFDQSVSSHPNGSVGLSYLELRGDQVADEISTIRTENVMDLVSVIERNNNDGLLLGDKKLSEEVDRKKERKEDNTEVKADMKELIVSNTMMLVDSFQQETNNQDPLPASMLSDEMMMKQVQVIDEAADQSRGNDKVRRGATFPVLKFPFKRLFQVQFKKKGRTSTYKTKKRD